MVNYPRWIIGPSGPIGIPQPMAVTHEKNFAISVFRLKILSTWVPLRNPVISGNPEPPALGCQIY